MSIPTSWLRAIVAHNRPMWATFAIGDPGHLDHVIASTVLAYYTSLDPAERALYFCAMLHCRDCPIDCGTLTFEFALGRPVSLADVRHVAAT